MCTISCFLSNLSFVHNGQFSFNASAKYGKSSSSGHICLAFFINSSYSFFGTIVIICFRISIISFSSCFVFPVFFRIMASCFFSSFIKNSGAKSDSSS